MTMELVVMVVVRVVDGKGSIVGFMDSIVSPELIISVTLIGNTESAVENCVWDGDTLDGNGTIESSDSLPLPETSIPPVEEQVLSEHFYQSRDIKKPPIGLSNSYIGTIWWKILANLGS